MLRQRQKGIARMTIRCTVLAAAPLAGARGGATLQEQAVVTLVVPTEAILPVLDRDDLAASLGDTPTCPC
jgi:hypothetical protein